MQSYSYHGYRIEYRCYIERGAEAYSVAEFVVRDAAGRFVTEQSLAYRTASAEDDARTHRQGLQRVRQHIRQCLT